MTLENYISEAVTHGRKHVMVTLTSDMNIDDFISALDASGFKQKTVPGTGARAVFLFIDAKKEHRRMYFVDRENPSCIWAVFPEYDIAYRFGFGGGEIQEVERYRPVYLKPKNGYNIDYLSNIESLRDKKGMENALKYLNNILY